VRIAAGKFGGRQLGAPADLKLRPTSDKVRQAIFNVIAHKDFGFGFKLKDTRVVDLFAGTGAMGIEALSRGAKYCLFIDNAAESRALIRRNVEALGLTGTTKIWRRDATELGLLDTLQPFDLAFLDPPYRKDFLEPALKSLRDGGWLKERSLVVAETSGDETAPAVPGYTLLDDRTYGETRVAFLARA